MKNGQLDVYSETPDLLNTLFQLLDDHRPAHLINKFQFSRDCISDTNIPTHNETMDISYLSVPEGWARKMPSEVGKALTLFTGTVPDRILHQCHRWSVTQDPTQGRETTCMSRRQELWGRKEGEAEKLIRDSEATQT